MDIKILSPLWGHEHLDLKTFLDKIKAAGYDGIDTWVPENNADKVILYNYLQQHEMFIVTHQHAASGNTFRKFRESFLTNLYQCAEPQPLLINSHTGRDYFSLQQNLDLIDIAQEFTARTGIVVAHETHRGRLGYCPQMMAELFHRRNDFLITADLSHWVCVTESMLENFEDILSDVITRTRHVHARVGFEEGPQVSDPAAPEWQYALNNFLSWWDRIVDHTQRINHKVLTFTTEFGPKPYMPAAPFTGKPVADQFAINCYMKDLLRSRYQKS